MLEIINRKARYDYEISDTYEAGIALKGTEIKSIRDGKANIKDSYVLVRDDEAFILNMHINLYDKGNQFNHEETRTRKLLLHKNEIYRMRDSSKIEGYTLIPLKLYFVKNKVKILIGVGKGKKIYDKRESMKQKEMIKEARDKMKKSVQ
jgi:SsrA-binding protein